jgi:hypothetical protein
LQIKKKSEAEIKLYKTDGISLQTSKDKMKISEMTEKYDRLMYFAYEAMRTYYSDPTKFTPELFRLMLIKSRVTLDSASSINKLIAAGKTFYELDRMNR